MGTETLYPLGLLITGLAVGALLGWLFQKLRQGSQYLSKAEVDKAYVSRDLYREKEEQLDVQLADLREKEEDIRRIGAEKAAKEEEIRQLGLQLQQQREADETRAKQQQLAFENLANRLLEEKGKQITQLNSQQIGDLLKPLRDHIKTFEDGIAKRFVEETRDRTSLRKEIEQLRELNEQLGREANDLTRALKGDSKVQGDWGELQLERLLEKAGLEKGIHFHTQGSFADEDGRQKRPDFIIELPEDKQLIIDSKVSLTAFERYCSSDDSEHGIHLKDHVRSVRNHIRQLSEKNYTELYEINSPDYLLLFIPLEPAFALAVREDQGLFTEALERNVVLVTTSTLLATMRTVSFIWKQEKQKRNVLEIAKQSGMLYDKFVAFVEDLQDIGKRLDQAHKAYAGAMNKLKDSKKYGDTLIGRAERIKSLGANAGKDLPTEFRDSV